MDFAGGRREIIVNQSEQPGATRSRSSRRPGQAEGQEPERARIAKRQEVDLEVFEQRVRGELQRLLSREVQMDDSPDTVEVELLEERIRHVLKRLLPGGAASQLGQEELPQELDLDLIERNIRSTLRSRIGSSIGERGLGSSLNGFDMVVLGQRVRQEVARALEGQPIEVTEGPNRASSFNRDLLEIRVKQELARRIPRLRELGWGGRSSLPQVSYNDVGLLSGGIRQVIRRVLQEYRDRAGPQLSDAEIEQLVERVLANP